MRWRYLGPGAQVSREIDVDPEVGTMVAPGSTVTVSVVGREIESGLPQT